MREWQRTITMMVFVWARVLRSIWVPARLGRTRKTRCHVISSCCIKGLIQHRFLPHPRRCLLMGSLAHVGQTCQVNPCSGVLKSDQVLSSHPSEPCCRLLMSSSPYSYTCWSLVSHATHELQRRDDSRAWQLPCRLIRCLDLFEYLSS